MLFVFCASLGFVIFAHSASAGFGATPPYIKNAYLRRGLTYTQKILLVQSDPKEDLQVEISVDVPRAGEWISFDHGRTFTVPKGERQMPVLISMTVPANAEYGTYEGAIRIKASTGAMTPGLVDVALGAKVDVAVTVTDKEILDFKVRRVDVSPLNEGHTFLWMYFPGKIRASILMENTGNAPAAPSRMTLDIYDKTGKALIKTIEPSNRLKKIPPFETETIEADFPIDLLPGDHKATYQLYKGEEVTANGDVLVQILPYGTVAGDTGYGVLGLSMRDKSILGILGAFILIAAWLIIARMKNRKLKIENDHVKSKMIP